MRIQPGGWIQRDSRAGNVPCSKAPTEFQRARVYRFSLLVAIVLPRSTRRLRNLIRRQTFVWRNPSCSPARGNVDPRCSMRINRRASARGHVSRLRGNAHARMRARESTRKPTLARSRPSVRPFLFRPKAARETAPAVRRPVYLRSDDELMGIPALNVCSVYRRNSRFVAREPRSTPRLGLGSTPSHRGGSQSRRLSRDRFTSAG